MEILTVTAVALTSSRGFVKVHGHQEYICRLTGWQIGPVSPKASEWALQYLLKFWPHLGKNGEHRRQQVCTRAGIKSGQVDYRALYGFVVLKSHSSEHTRLWLVQRGQHASHSPPTLLEAN